MSNEELLRRIVELEKRIAEWESVDKDVARRKTQANDLILKGRVFADRVFVKRSGSYVELTT